MDDLRELDKKAQELFDRNKLWHPVRDPVACAEMDGEMQQKGFWGALLRLDDACLAVYFTPGQYGLKGLMNLLNENGSRGATEYEARTRAAVRALSGEGEK